MPSKSQLSKHLGQHTDIPVDVLNGKPAANNSTNNQSTSSNNSNALSLLASVFANGLPNQATNNINLLFNNSNLNQLVSNPTFAAALSALSSNSNKNNFNSNLVNSSSGNRQSLNQSFQSNNSSTGLNLSTQSNLQNSLQSGQFSPGLTQLTSARGKFRCDHCPKLFTDQSNLQRHIRQIHSKYLPSSLGNFNLLF